LARPQKITIPCQSGPGKTIDNVMMFDATMVGRLTLSATISNTENPNFEMAIIAKDEDLAMTQQLQGLL